MADNKGVMIFTEVIDGKLRPLPKNCWAQAVSSPTTLRGTERISGRHRRDEYAVRRLPLARIRFTSSIPRC